MKRETIHTYEVGHLTIRAYYTDAKLDSIRVSRDGPWLYQIDAIKLEKEELEQIVTILQSELKNESP